MPWYTTADARRDALRQRDSAQRDDVSGTKISTANGCSTLCAPGELCSITSDGRCHASTTGNLWCIHIPGTDEVYAAPSKVSAEHMAERHNKAMADYYASNHPNLEFAPSLDSVQALVIKWPHDAESHADEMREFDWSGWGITQKEQG